MPLSAGDKLGPYEILAPIGAGGMGEVHKARDTRLGRIVAIKVLPEHIARREDLRARFEREARAVASLNHPNICTLHDIGNQDGAGYMVMEYMEGETLAARIEKGALPLDQAVKFATQIADALDRAHRAGVTHRDVKPQNIMLTRDGVKVLDFGLAKSTPKPGPSEATLTAVLTTEGTVMGTPQYMAPEQFEGKEADARSDIWAFGAVLYEMVTGQKAFQGKSYSSLLGAILSADPLPMSVKPFTPAWLERLVKQCLQKDPEDRYQSMRDVVLDLSTPPQESAAAGPPRAAGWPWAIAGLAGALALALSFLHLREMPPQDFPMRFSVLPPEDGTVSHLALSPDGRQLVLGSPLQLYVRSMDSPKLVPLKNTNNGRAPFWSPDSRFIAFFGLDGKLKVIPAGGGPVQTLCSEIGVGVGGTWNRDGLILFAAQRGALYSVGVNDLGSGTPATCAPLVPQASGSDSTTEARILPVFLPDGKHFLYLRQSEDESRRGLYLASLTDVNGKRLLPDNSSAVFAPSRLGASAGHLIFLRGTDLMAQPFDAGSLELTGEPSALADSASISATPPQVAASASDNGTVAYVANLLPERQLIWFDHTGKELSRLGKPGNPRGISLSFDGKQVAFTQYLDAAGGIWVRDLERDTEARVSPPNTREETTAWAPDGRRLAFKSRDGIHVRELPGGNSQLVLASASALPTDWSHDGRSLIYTDEGDIWVLPDVGGPSGSRQPIPLVKTPAQESQVQLSPDGSWLAYTSDESGTYQVHIREVITDPSKDETRASERSWQVSNSASASEPRWRRDGRELFYLDTTSVPRLKLMAVPITLGHTPPIGIPKLVFEITNRQMLPRLNQLTYAPSPDGQRFLFSAPAKDAKPSVDVLLNWQAGLKK